MICQWCEGEDNIITLCDFDDHIICKKCYEKYLKIYPKRIKGCPYCKGTEEISVITQPLIPTIHVASTNTENSEGCSDICCHGCCYLCALTCMGIMMKGLLLTCIAGVC